MARSTIAMAFNGPMPLLPSHCSNAPKAAVKVGTATGSIKPAVSLRTNDGKRSIPWVVTPSRVLSAKIAAKLAVRSAPSENLPSTWA